MRVLVCGGRGYADVNAVFAALDEVHQKRGITMVIQGAHWNDNNLLESADWLAELWARKREITFVGEPAQWAVHGKSAGPKRNGAMLEKWLPDGVIAFPGGRGTADMIRQAKAKDIKVWQPKG